MIVVLLAAAYAALPVFVLCLLTVAKRGDEAIQLAAEPADPAPLGEPARLDLGLALTDVDAAFVGRFDRRAFAAEAAVPPHAA